MKRESPKYTPIGQVAAKYAQHGWTTAISPRGGINDVIASKGNRLHFVQVITPSTKDARSSQEAINAFVQNAFSNKATPVFATLDGEKVRITDVNANTDLRFGNKSKIEYNSTVV